MLTVRTSPFSSTILSERDAKVLDRLSLLLQDRRMKHKHRHRHHQERGGRPARRGQRQIPSGGNTLWGLVEGIVVRALRPLPLRLQISGAVLLLAVYFLGLHPDPLYLMKTFDPADCQGSEEPKPPVVLFADPPDERLTACGVVEIRGFIRDKETKMSSFVAMLDTSTNRLHWTGEITTGSLGEFAATLVIEYPGGVYRVVVMTPLSDEVQLYLLASAASRPPEGVPAPTSGVDAFYSLGPTVVCTCPPPQPPPQPPRLAVLRPASAIVWFLVALQSTDNVRPVVHNFGREGTSPSIA